MMVSLNITDIPVGYAPPRGPRVDFKVTYNQRESFQPTTFTYSNFGPKWTFDYLSYVEDDPSNALADAYVYARGGGQETFAHTGGGVYVTHFETYAELVQITHNPPVYERRLPDGSVEVFSRSDGSAGPSRKVFLSEWRDPQGNALSFEYDLNPALLRLTKIVDALGQVTDLFYEHADPYKITKVEDPFGRQATFTYNAEGQLETITDVIGLVSSFEYGLNDFITALVTPYGRTTFAMGEFKVNGRNRWLEATDPLGARERIEYWNQTFFVPGSEDDYEVPWDPNGIVPFGGDPEEVAFRGNDNLEFRNTFYWSKLAMDRHPGDFEKAEILHWLKDLDPNQTSGTLESRKMPLENRVWYAYEGQTNFNHRGTQNQPIFVGRVVDVDEANPTRQARTQLFQYEYDSKGNTIKSIDPIGRETIFEYDSNNIDLLRVKRKTGLGEDLLKELTYNTANQPLTMTDTAGQTTTSTYNAFGQLETETTPERAGITENRTTTYEYDADGYLFAVTGPAPGATKNYTYDDFRRMRTMTDSDDYTLTYDYDAFDRLTKLSYPRCVRLTKLSYPDGTFTETVYDKLDGRWTRDRAGRWNPSRLRCTTTSCELDRSAPQNDNARVVPLWQPGCHHRPERQQDELGARHPGAR